MSTSGRSSSVRARRSPRSAASWRRLPRPVSGSVTACSRIASWATISAAACGPLHEHGQQLLPRRRGRRVAARDGDRAARLGLVDAVAARSERPTVVRAVRRRSRGRLGRASMRRRCRPGVRGVVAAPSSSQATAIGVERLDRAAQHDVGERVEVELARRRRRPGAGRRPGGGCAREPTQLEAALGLLRCARCDRGPAAGAARERQDEQELRRVLRARRRRPASRPGARQASTATTWTTTRICRRGAMPSAAASRSVAETRSKQAAGEQCATTPAAAGREVDRAARRDDQHDRRAERVPRVGDREEQALGRSRARRTRPRSAEDEAGGRQQRHGRGRQQHEHRNQHQVRGDDVPGADGNSIREISA